jgi:hypothetical protein
MAKNSGNILGGWAFFVGVILAIVAGILSAMGSMDITGSIAMSIFVIIGVIVGLLNVTSKESNSFLFSGLVLIVASTFGMSIMVMVPFLSSLLIALLAIFVPATIVVAIKNVFSIAKQ